jgi:hypothetical protein
MESLAWQHSQRLKCPGCDQWRDEAGDIDHEDCWDAQVSTCHACAATRRELKRFEKDGLTDGLYAAPYLSHSCGQEHL